MSEDVVVDKHQIPKEMSVAGSVSPELVNLIAELVYEMLKRDIRLDSERFGRGTQLRKQW